MSSRYLLDTHAIYWATQSPENLSKAARKIITGPGPLVVSVASLWEIILKSRKQSLAIADPVAWWDRALADLGAGVLSIRANHVRVLDSLPEIHRDPFDRILIAQAAADGLILVSGDETIQQYPINVVW